MRPTTRKGRFLALKEKMKRKLRKEEDRFWRTHKNPETGEYEHADSAWKYPRLGKQMPLWLLSKDIQKREPASIYVGVGPPFLTHDGPFHTPHVHALEGLELTPAEVNSRRRYGWIFYHNRRVVKLGRKTDRRRGDDWRRSVYNYFYWRTGYYSATDIDGRRPQEGNEWDMENLLHDGGFWPGDPLDSQFPWPPP